MKPSQPIPKWISIAQAAAILGVGKNWLSETRRNKRAGPPWYQIRNKIRYREEEVLAFLESCRRTS